MLLPASSDRIPFALPICTTKRAILHNPIYSKHCLSAESTLCRHQVLVQVQREPQPLMRQNAAAHNNLHLPKMLGRSGIQQMLARVNAHPIAGFVTHLERMDNLWDFA